MNKDNPSGAEFLRQQAEERLKKKSVEHRGKHSEVETLKLIHELEVHQVELGIQNQELVLQNDELLLARSAAQEAAEKYLEIYDFAPTGYCTLSEQGEIKEINFYGAALLGKERMYLQGAQFGFFVSDETKGVFFQFLNDVFRSKAKETYELALMTKEGLNVFIAITGILIGSGEQCLVQVVDITKRKKFELELIIANKELVFQNEEKEKRAAELIIANKELAFQAELILINKQLQLSNAEKDKFFSVLAHDLRSPFNSLLGFTQMMVEDLPTMTEAEIQKMTRLMRNSITNVYGLLENLLEWGRMQRGMIPFDPAPMLLLPSGSSDMKLAMDLANKKDITIRNTISDDLIVFADHYMLSGILRNLTSNAVKFTPKGGKVEIAAKQIDSKWVEISVQDSGIGMSKAMIENLFRLDVNTSRKGTAGEASTGLGLIITKEFVEKNGGRLWVESDEGQGSTFYFTLKKASDAEPKTISQDIPSDLKENKQAKNLKVLIVEDDEASKMIFSISLKREGFVVLEARTGLEAVEICRNTAGIDLVLMDINLPEMDGIEATHQIRQFNKNVVIIAQTAYSKEFPNFGQKLTDAGCNDYILKPIDNMEIKRLIQKHLPI